MKSGGGRGRDREAGKCHTLKSNQRLKEKAPVGTFLPSFLRGVIGFDLLSSREGQIGGKKNDLNSVFHPDAFNLAGGKQVLHRD